MHWGNRSSTRRRLTVWWFAVAALGAVSCAPPSPTITLAREPALPPRTAGADPSTSVEPAPTDTVAAAGSAESVAPATATAPVPPEPAAPESVAIAASVAPAGPTWSIEPYRGLGVWVDVFDWATEYATPGEPAFALDDVDRLADQGVQTLYLQLGRFDSPSAVVEPERLVPIIDRAHERNIAVVGWYLPTFVDVEVDLARMRAMLLLDIDGFGVDIEARDVADIDERNRRLIELSARLHDDLGDRTLSAIVLPPVLIEELSATFWPRFPWREIAPFYDVWLPMSYWTNRRGQWRSSHDYTAENIDRIRLRIGVPDAPVHAVGGIGDGASDADMTGFVVAAEERRAIGGSIYDYVTTQDAHWEILRRFRT